MNQPSLFAAPPELPFDQPPPVPVVEEKPVLVEAVRAQTPEAQQPQGKRMGYQISAKPASDPEDPGTCTYTEAFDEEGALARARQEFPLDEGWVEHAAKLIPGAC